MEWAGMVVGAMVAAYCALLLTVHPLGRRWLAYWHGRGEAHQKEYYRCLACRRLVTWARIRRGGCRCKESYKISPAMLTWAEKARLLWLPWTV